MVTKVIPYFIETILQKRVSGVGLHGEAMG